MLEAETAHKKEKEEDAEEENQEKEEPEPEKIEIGPPLFSLHSSTIPSAGACLCHGFSSSSKASQNPKTPKPQNPKKKK